MLSGDSNVVTGPIEWFDRESRSVYSQIVTIGTFSKAVDYAPYYIAKRFNWLQRNATKGNRTFTINSKEYNDRKTLAADLKSGQRDIILAAEAPLIITKAEGVDLTMAYVSCTLVKRSQYDPVFQ